MVNLPGELNAISRVIKGQIGNNSENIRINKEIYVEIERQLIIYIRILIEYLSSNEFRNQNNFFGTDRFTQFGEILIKKIAFLTDTVAKLRSFYDKKIREEIFNTNIRNNVKTNIQTNASLNDEQSKILKQLLLNINNAINDDGRLKLKNGRQSLYDLSRGKYLFNNYKNVYTRMLANKAAQNALNRNAQNRTNAQERNRLQNEAENARRERNRQSRYARGNEEATRERNRQQRRNAINRQQAEEREALGIQHRNETNAMIVALEEISRNFQPQPPPLYANVVRRGN